MSIEARADNILLRKLLTKLSQRIGMVYLKPRIASWRYQKGKQQQRLNIFLLF